MLQLNGAAAAKMDPARLAGAVKLLDRSFAEGAFGGYVAGVSRHGSTVLLHAGGYGCRDQQVSMTVRTLFDMASVTKVMATLPAVLSLMDDGALSLDEPVYYLMKEFDRPDKRLITVRHLLSHSSGLPGWRPTYAHCAGAADVVPYIAGLELGFAPGTDVQYTCLGYIVLGELVRRVSGQPLDRFVAERIYQPLGMAETGFTPAVGAEVAATEEGNQYEAEMVQRAGFSFDRWRTGMTQGAVNDGNAHYTMGGVSGNAGLFASAEDVLTYGQMWLQGGATGDSRVLSEAVTRLAVQEHTPGLSHGRGLGWIVQRPTPPHRAEFMAAPSSVQFFPPERYEAFAPPRSGGDYLTPGSYGHTGFTGTSIWMDPAHQLVITLLTNRTHPRVDPRIAWVRPRFHNAVVAACYS